MPLLGISELLGHWHVKSRAPAIDDWQAIVEPLRELRKDGDLVIVAPYWAEPAARRVFGDVEMPLVDVARPDNSGYQRALEISLLGERALPDWKLLEEAKVDKFTLRVLENPQYEPVFGDFLGLLRPENVTVTSGSKASARACSFKPRARVRNGALHGHPTFPRQRFECGKGKHFVGVTVIEDELYRPRRCIWANPTKRKPLSLQFKQVELKNRVQGYGGISYFDERDGRGGGVEMTVVVGGEPVGAYRHAPGEGWTPFRFETTGSGQQDVEFRIRATGNKTPRGFCFQADIR